MNLPLVFRTVRYVTPVQIWYQLWYKAHKAKYKPLQAPNHIIPNLPAEPIAKTKSVEGDVFTFLNVEQTFNGWNSTKHGNLWAYNQNYFDWLGQEGMTVTDGCSWIDKFIAAIEQKEIVKGLHPYPIALRSINWIKFFCSHPDCATKIRLDSLYSQIRVLEQKLEFQLLGNHLLEDAFALYIGTVFFNDESLANKAKTLMKRQLKEQILPDGEHFEQSPMYQCVLLDRLLDCYNFSLTTKDDDIQACLKMYANKMLGNLESLVWADGSIPLFNDSANGIAPSPEQLFDYAKRLGLAWVAIPMKECGYRKMSNNTMEAIVDVGNITASYQPGHSHADTFNYELRIEGKPYVVDTGVSTYNNSSRRHYERSTPAHNTVSVNVKDSSEVWGGFRVGRRATISDVRCQMEEGRGFVEASHDGFGKECRRRFEMKDDSFIVEDWFDGNAVSYIHLAKDADINRIKVEGALNIETEDGLYSTEYNRFTECKVMKIHFMNHLKYKILQ